MLSHTSPLDLTDQDALTLIANLPQRRLADSSQRIDGASQSRRRPGPVDSPDEPVMVGTDGERPRRSDRQARRCPQSSNPEVDRAEPVGACRHAGVVGPLGLGLAELGRAGCRVSARRTPPAVTRSTASFPSWACRGRPRWRCCTPPGGPTGASTRLSLASITVRCRCCVDRPRPLPHRPHRDRESTPATTVRPTPTSTPTSVPGSACSALSGCLVRGCGAVGYGRWVGVGTQRRRWTWNGTTY